MRQMEFTMSRPNLVKPGDEVDITEPDRLKSRHGIVKEVGETSRGYYVLAEFDE